MRTHNRPTVSLALAVATLTQKTPQPRLRHAAQTKEDAMPNDVEATETGAADTGVLQPPTTQTEVHAPDPDPQPPQAAPDPDTMVATPQTQTPDPQRSGEDWQRMHGAAKGRLQATIREHQQYRTQVDQAFSAANSRMEKMQQENETLRAQVAELEASRPLPPPPAELVEEYGEHGAAVQWKLLNQLVNKQHSGPETTAQPAPTSPPVNPHQPAPSQSFTPPQAPQIDENTMNVLTHLDYAVPDWQAIIRNTQFNQWKAVTVNRATGQTYEAEFEMANMRYDAHGLERILKAFKASTGNYRGASPEHILPEGVGTGSGVPSSTPGIQTLPSPEELRQLYKTAAGGGARGRTAQEKLNIIEAKMKEAMASSG